VVSLRGRERDTCFGPPFLGLPSTCFACKFSFSGWKTYYQVVNDRGTKFSRGPGAGAFKHIYKFSYLKESKSNVYCTHIAIVDIILKRCSYFFLQCKAKNFFQKYEVETLIKYMANCNLPAKCIGAKNHSPVNLHRSFSVTANFSNAQINITWQKRSKEEPSLLHMTILNSHSMTER